ncbi:MAG: serine hydrolase [Ignavibacteriales bacterium]|nr:serine hydrolase [Ignavibacteriales bacterium]
MRILNQTVGVILFFAGGLLGHSVQAQSQERIEIRTDVQKRVDSLFVQWDKPNSPGCALGVIKNGELIYRRGYGMANLEHGIPISARSVFDLASMSKQFTAACVVLLSQQGKLSLDDDVRKYIPELPAYGKMITIRKLLNHTSGLRDYPDLMDLAGYQLEEVTNTRDALGIISRQKTLNFNPGEEWLYSNSGYFLASVIVERVSGKSMQAFAKENIFEPLGMTATMYLDNHATIVPHRATGYELRKEGGFQIKMSNWEETGDGAIQTSVEDLLMWDNNFYNPKVGGKALIEQLLTPGKLNSGEKLQYALGLSVGTYKGLDMISHGGAWAGYRAELIRFPKQKLSVVCLCNLATMDPSRLAQQVAEVYLTDQMKQDQNIDVGPSGTNENVKFTHDELSRYLGYYRNPADETVRKTILREGKLVYVRGPENETELAPVTHDKFRMVDVPQHVMVTFTLAESGKVSGMQVIVASGKPTMFQSFKPAAPTKEQLGAYAGTFYSEELDVNYVVASQDSQLVVRIRRLEAKPLSPTIADVFKNDDIGWIRFTRDNRNAIVGFTLSTGRVRNVIFEKR